MNSELERLFRRSLTGFFWKGEEYFYRRLFVSSEATKSGVFFRFRDTDCSMFAMRTYCSSQVALPGFPQWWRVWMFSEVVSADRYRCEAERETRREDPRARELPCVHAVTVKAFFISMRDGGALPVDRARCHLQSKMSALFAVFRDGGRDATAPTRPQRFF